MAKKYCEPSIIVDCDFDDVVLTSTVFDFSEDWLVSDEEVEL